jgi:hypothetical protein
VTTTAPPAAGLTLTELAARLGLRSPQRAAFLIEPFIAAGLVDEIDGLLVVTNREIRAAFAQERPTA